MKILLPLLAVLVITIGITPAFAGAANMYGDPVPIYDDHLEIKAEYEAKLLDNQQRTQKNLDKIAELEAKIAESDNPDDIAQWQSEIAKQQEFIDRKVIRIAEIEVILADIQEVLDHLEAQIEEEANKQDEETNEQTKPQSSPEQRALTRNIDNMEKQIAKYQRQIAGHEERINKISIQIENNTDPERAEKLDQRLAQNTDDIAFKQSEIIRLQTVLDDLYADLEPTTVEVIVPETVPETRTQTSETVPETRTQTSETVPETRTQTTEQEPIYVEIPQEESEPTHIELEPIQIQPEQENEPIYVEIPQEPTPETFYFETEQQENDPIHIEIPLELPSYTTSTTPEKEEVNTLVPHVMTDESSYTVGDTIYVTGLWFALPNDSDDFDLVGDDISFEISMEDNGGIENFYSHNILYQNNGETMDGLCKDTYVVNEDWTFSCNFVLTEDLFDELMTGEYYIYTYSNILTQEGYEWTQAFIIQ